MSYKYSHSLPFENKWYVKNKDIKFTDEIRLEMDNYYQYINSICKEDYINDKGKIAKNKIVSLINDLSVRYKQLRQQYIRPIVEEKYKYKSLLYTQEEVEFIFICSYHLIDKFGFSQEDLAKIFGINKNKFSKLGCFPARCYDAYTKLDDVSARKSIIPNNTNSVGIQIADCINKKVQAVHTCSAFIGVSNNLDTLVNMSTTDNKTFINTYPTSDDIVKSSFSYARFLFASSNNFENKVGNCVAGSVKRKIIELLKMRDDEPLEFSNYLLEILRDGDEYREFCTTSTSGRFTRELELYRGQLDLISRIDAGEYSVDDLIYDEEYANSVGIDLSEITFDLEDEDSLREYLVQSSQEIRVSLIKNMSYAYQTGFDDVLFEDYKMCLLMFMVKKCSLILQENKIGTLAEDDKIRLAAIYWILENCGNELMTEQRYDTLLKYLKSKKLLSYFDAVNKEVKKGKVTHLFYECEEFNIDSFLDDSVGISDIDSPPILLYLDIESYKAEMGYLVSMLQEKNILLVVRDTENFTNEWGMQLLDKKLSLYIKEH